MFSNPNIDHVFIINFKRIKPIDITEWNRICNLSERLECYSTSKNLVEKAQRRYNSE
jgi:hypothetical protein